uniref:K-box domain-containing protein n=2 Tax=Cucumis sativus TaxID=3659 RepID=A0A0A0KFD8_CUCSA
MRYQSHLQGRNESPIDNDLQGTSESLIDNDAKDHVSDETILVSLKKLLQTIQSQVEEPNFKKLDITQMVQLENQLESTLDKIKSQRIEAMIENDDCWTYDMDMAMGMINSPPFN